MSWFKDWFNSEYYHILYKDRDTKEAQNFIDNLIKNLNIKKNSKIIDIACGKGRHAKYLNQQGMDVIGIDISPESIKYAKKHENLVPTNVKTSCSIYSDHGNKANEAFVL